jgi:HD-GYP domain-containing protein (c-di-GMP phosphodiesterase class II)
MNEALDLMRGLAGTKWDADCIRALEAVLQQVAKAAEPGRSG